MHKKLQSPFTTRQHMLSEDFELYYYNDAHYTPTKKHDHDYYEIFFFSQGVIDMHIDQQIHSLISGDLIILPPGTPHHAVSRNPDTPYRRFILWISKPYFEKLISFSSDYNYMINYTITHNKYVYHFDATVTNMIQAGLFRIIEETQSNRFGRDVKITLSFMDLWIYLNRLIYEKTQTHTQNETHNLCQTILVYINTHLGNDLSLDTLASIFYTSKYHIAHIIKENLGISLHQYILKKRLFMCRDALLNGDSITKTFHIYGFKDYSCFFRAFKKEYGLSPKEFQDLHMITGSSKYSND